MASDPTHPEQTKSPRFRALGAIAAIAIPGLLQVASATVSSTMVADTYIVKDGSRVYSVLDIYVKGSSLGDVVSSVTGLNGTSGHPVVFATSQALGTGLTRDSSGKITAGTITSDIFVQAGSSSWEPTYSGSGASWDSFVTVGGRKQNASVTNRAASLKAINASNMQYGLDFTQAKVANSNFINNSGGGGWYNTLGASAYLSGGSPIASEMPFARVSLYDPNWNATYTDLDRSGLVLSKGKVQTGRATAAGSSVFSGDTGTALELCWMVGRFTIDVTGKSPSETITMNAQFNMVGKNGTGNETGTTFSGASTATYKASSFFTFAVPPSPPSAPTGLTAGDGASTGLVRLDWSATATATGYEIYRNADGGTPVQIGSSATNGFDDASAPAGVLLSYRVKAVNSEGSSDFSATDTGWRALAAPTGVTASDGTVDSGVAVNWTSVAGATGYRVYRSAEGVPQSLLGSPATTTYSDTSATPGKLYTYAIAAACALGESAKSSDTGWRTLTPPGSLTATTNLTDRVRLDWVESTGATGYRVYRGASTPDTLLASIGPGATYSDLSATPGVTYFYAVRALGAGTPESAPSATVTGSRATVPAPTVASATPSSGPLVGGTTITVSGANFIVGATTVTVGGVAATGVSVSSATSLTCVTPAGTAGSRSVAVTTIGGTGTLAGGFTYLAAPTVGTVNPSLGPTSGGTTITMSGSGFVTGATTVTVGGVAATGVSVSSATSLTCVTPAGTAGSKDVVATTAGGSGTKTNAFTYLAAPTIASITPASGPFSGGTIISISGANFLAGGTTVTIGGIPATGVSVSSATSLTATTQAATSAGAKDVVISTPGGSVTSTGGFTFAAPVAPTITSVTPPSGPISGGTTIGIVGTDFLPGGTTVTVGGVAATSISVTSPTSITAKTPAGTPGAKDVVVTTVGGSATRTGAFTHLAAPTVATVTPTSGPMAGGTTITVTGPSFVVGSTSVTVGGVAATSLSVTSATSLTARTPAGAPGLRDVTVSTPGGSATKASAFNFLQTPVISSVLPEVGPLAGGTTITVTGNGFVVGSTTVTVGGVPATSIAVSSAGALTARTPAGTAGAKDVTVTTAGGSATKVSGFSYVAPPTLASVAPENGPLAGGTTITLNGTGFVVGGTTVTVGGVAATNISVASATTLTAKTPAGTAGTKDVTVTTVGGSVTKTAAFRYLAAPTIASVSPASGSLGGGTTITVSGTNFVAGLTNVSVGGTAATGVSVTSPTTLTATTPAGGSAGAKDVLVSTPGGTATKAAGFTYLAISAPTITLITPSSGPLAGGTMITVNGTSFVPGSTTVKIGGVTAKEVSVTSATTLTAMTPAGASAGAKDVAVTSNLGTATKSGGFTYDPAVPPSVASVAPTSGPLAGGTTITITGANFLPVTMVSIGGVAATNVTVLGATTIRAVTPAGTAGAKNVTVATTGGSGTRLGGFTYVAAPKITSISPASGPTSGGTSIIILGTSLSRSTVTIGGAAATVISASSTTINASTPAGTVGAKDVVVTAPGGAVTRSAGFTYVASLTGGGPGGMPVGGGRGGADGPSDTTPPEGTQPIEITMARCVELIEQSSAPLAECAGTPCGDLPPASLAAIEDGPTGPDLDGNGVPDLCQLRCGDLDMSAVVDMGDLAVLLTMFGEAPLLGIGDLDGDGEIGPGDLLDLQQAIAAARSGPTAGTRN